MLVKAKAKINLTLNVLSKREDNYHELALIFQPISLEDYLYVEENETGQLKFTCSVRAFANEKNLVCLGYYKMKELFGEKIKGLTIHLEKHIPSGAGMAGGSTDCSALLLWMNEHFSLNLSLDELIQIGVTLGADVPACMMPYPTMGRGVGEKLSPIHLKQDYPILLLKPYVSFPTGKMFQRIDASPNIKQRDNHKEMIQAMESGDLVTMAQNLYNVFEEVVPEKRWIQQLKDELIKVGALGSLMTGSGSCVYGIFESKKKRDQGYQALKHLPRCQVIPCEGVSEWS